MMHVMQEQIDACNAIMIFRVHELVIQVILLIKLWVQNWVSKAASTFILKADWEGGFQTSLLDCTTGPTTEWTYVCQYFSRYSTALLFRQIGSSKFPPCSTLFGSISSTHGPRIVPYLPYWPPYVHFCNFFMLPALHPKKHYSPTKHVKLILEI